VGVLFIAVFNNVDRVHGRNEDKGVDRRAGCKMLSSPK